MREYNQFFIQYSSMEEKKLMNLDEKRKLITLGNKFERKWDINYFLAREVLSYAIIIQHSSYTSFSSSLSQPIDFECWIETSFFLTKKILPYSDHCSGRGTWFNTKCLAFSFYLLHISMERGLKVEQRIYESNFFFLIDLKVFSSLYILYFTTIELIFHLFV